jgi:hypothetical protein
MNVEELEGLKKLTLAAKPVSELTYMKGIALLLAGMQAQKCGTMSPDDFLTFVIGYCLRNDVQEVADGAEDVGKGGNSGKPTDAPAEAIRKRDGVLKMEMKEANGESGVLLQFGDVAAWMVAGKN